MNRLLYSLAAICLLTTCFSVDASVIYAKITGDVVEWSNAAISDSGIQPLQWESSNKFNMLPVRKWSPAFYKNPQKSLTFRSSIGAELTTSFKHNGIDFRTSVKSDQIPGGIGNARLCQVRTITAGEIRLRSESSCGSDTILDQGNRYIPFEFYRPSFEMPNIVSDFMQSKLPAGRYVASFSQPVAYYVIYEHNQIESYQIYQDDVKIIIDYQPSFLDSVQVVGSGQFDIEYDTSNHTARGETSYKIQVNGYITPGIKMSFKSSEKEDDFSLVSNSNAKIPYDMICEACVDKQVIKDGVMDKEFAKIEFEGNRLDFNLDFSFDNLHYGDVDEGDYSDAVTVIFEIDL